jgi:chemotaxis-related protein WspD
MTLPTDPSNKPSSRARHLLDREPPPDYLREWTERIASVAETTEAGTNSVVVFRIGFEWLALPTRLFQEVAERCALHTVPHRRGGVLAGLVNIRGELLLCASLDVVLGLDQGVETKREKNSLIYDRLLIVDRNGSRLAFPVDEVHGILRYDSRDLKPLPATLEKAANAFTVGLLSWGDKSVGRLDEELLFYKLNKSFA